MAFPKDVSKNPIYRSFISAVLLKLDEDYIRYTNFLIRNTFTVKNLVHEKQIGEALFRTFQNITLARLG
jgi:hypothetical protein